MRDELARRGARVDNDTTYRARPATPLEAAPLLAALDAGRLDASLVAGVCAGSYGMASKRPQDVRRVRKASE